MPKNGFIADEDVKQLLHELSNQKPAFLAALQSKVEAHISSQKTRECLGLVIRESNGRVVKNVPAAIEYDYAEKLYYFCRQKSLGQDIIDSILTDQVVGIFSKEYDKFIENNVDRVNIVVLQVLLKDETIVSRLKTALLNNAAISTAQAGVKRTVIDRMFEGLASQFDGPIHAVKTKASSVATVAVTKAAAAASVAVSSTVAKAMIAKFAVMLAAQLKIIVVRALATPAIKAAIIIAVKKVVIAAVLAAFLHVIAAKLGMTVGAALMWIIIPLILAFLAKEWWYFPEKIGKNIGSELTKEMEGRFSSLTEQVVVGIFNQVSNFGLIELEGFLLADVEVAGLVNAASKELAEHM